MGKKTSLPHLHRLSVVVPAVGVIVAGLALMFNFFANPTEKSGNMIELNQSASDGAVNIGGNNFGSVNTGDLNGDDK